MTCFTEIRALLQCLEPTLSLRWACIWKVAQCLRIRLKRSISERLQGGWGGSGTPCCEVVGPAGFPAPPGEQASPANLCVGRRVIRMEPGSRPDHRPWDPGLRPLGLRMGRHPHPAHRWCRSRWRPRHACSCFASSPGMSSWPARALSPCTSPRPA